MREDKQSVQGYSESIGFIHIDGIPRTFYTATYGNPSLLFPLLITSAREAFAVTGGKPGSEVTAAYPAAIYMAGILMADEAFLAGHPSGARGHKYDVDFSAGIIKLQTKIFCRSNGPVSLINVRIEGSFVEGQFAVFGTSSDKILTYVSETDITKHDFFSKELPNAISGSSTQEDLETSRTHSVLVGHAIDLQFQMAVSGKLRWVRIVKQSGDKEGKVVDCETGETLFLLPLQVFNNLTNLRTMLHTFMAESANGNQEANPADQGTPGGSRNERGAPSISQS